jgi:hypothetical protein
MSGIYMLLTQNWNIITHIYLTIHAHVHSHTRWSISPRPFGSSWNLKPCFKPRCKCWSVFQMFQASGSTTCVECPAGKVSFYTGSSVCSECDPGQFVAKAGQIVCQDCERGSYSVTASEGALQSVWLRASNTGLCIRHMWSDSRHLLHTWIVCFTALDVRTHWTWTVCCTALDVRTHWTWTVCCTALDVRTHCVLHCSGCAYTLDLDCVLHCSGCAYTLQVRTCIILITCSFTSRREFIHKFIQIT